ncbi:MAG TPA: FGGY-family carbohydrate kinase [Thermoanaerobacterales bacterium]|nr:FGGY-family carbohydrate kinase [Thermoanaerobacterales bacterium]
MIVIGIDIGTQGVRNIAVDESGKKICIAHEELQPFTSINRGWKEQNPKDWERAFRICFKKLLEGIKIQGYSLSEVKAISVDGTSGTIIPIDNNNLPLMNAIMYNDSRAGEETEHIKSLTVNFSDKVGYSFNSSFALPKILWIKENLQEVYQNTWKFIHQTDFIVGVMTGIYDITDHSNALKTGFDLVDYKWPDSIIEKLGLDLQKFPRVIRPGDVIANISKNFAQEFGLSCDTTVVAGMTDGCAGQVASGAVQEGTWNSILGTTLVVKGITQNLIKDRCGRIYSHLHPEGYWMPGGASNTGGECLEKVFPAIDYKDWDLKAERYLPTNLIIYPLVKKGERFPFINSEAEGFISGESQSDIELYAGYLEGVSFFERLCYDTLSDLGATVSDKIYVTGGGTKSRIWMKLRASVLNKTLLMPKISDPCMGSAVVAASRTVYKNLLEAAANMVRPGEIIAPDHRFTGVYEEKYNTFKCIMRQKGYID